jgi:hypothetical protein
VNDSLKPARSPQVSTDRALAASVQDATATVFVTEMLIIRYSSDIWSGWWSLPAPYRQKDALALIEVLQPAGVARVLDP